MKSKSIYANENGKNIFIGNHTIEKLHKRITVLAQWIWQIDNYKSPTHRQSLDRSKWYNQRTAMLNELYKRTNPLAQSI